MEDYATEIVKSTKFILGRARQTLTSEKVESIEFTFTCQIEFVISCTFPLELMSKAWKAPRKAYSKRCTRYSYLLKIGKHQDPTVLRQRYIDLHSTIGWIYCLSQGDVFPCHWKVLRLAQYAKQIKS